MFIITLTYIKPLETIDALIPEHRAFLTRHYANGTFLFSGPKIPRNGGIIIATGESREAMEAVISEDPFHREQAAKYEIVEFTPAMTAEALNDFCTA
ncbi:YciI family protein [Pseudodesulfovibrio piezophilus]|uniref:YCII-related protein n=1 Tax=Pseudodesulfovibrio piezophilus (strain DSM 21447 / JCM 15486 / C1TLV30) TaxID=1322246 RepID=M1WK68_PSEP2|nr:YciI family protein [Pseudodesulfovibrio piezophilus]CCH49076.1 YCII-related protein [Pseudodesulfovibrio piezophilus C1TLV30]